MDKGNALHVAFVADAKYAQHAAVMSRSLVLAHPHRKVVLHFVHAAELPQAQYDRVRSVIEGCGGTLVDVPIPNQWMARFKPHPLLGVSAWLRILLPELLPDLDRLLYLDCDLIVRRPLDALWDFPLAGHLVAAARNPLYPHQPVDWIRTLGLPGPERYFNTGVLLMDLAGLRAGQYTERLTAFVENGAGPMPYADQDALNALLWNRRTDLPPHFNAQNPWFELRPSRLPASASEVRALRRDPSIVHFSGMMKPWFDACGHPWRKLYWQHLEHTPWRGAEPEQRQWRNVVLRHVPYWVYKWYWRAFRPVDARTQK